MNKSTLKITFVALILFTSFSANATGGGKKPDPTLNHVQCWYSSLLNLMSINHTMICVPEKQDNY